MDRAPSKSRVEMVAGVGGKFMTDADMLVDGGYAAI